MDLALGHHLLSQWWFLLLLTVGVVVASFSCFKPESAADRRDRIKAKVRKKDPVLEGESIENLIASLSKENKPAAPKAPTALKDAPPPLRWTQTDGEVEVYIKVSEGTKSSDIKAVFTSSALSLSVRKEVVLQGRTFKGLAVDGCNWQMAEEPDIGGRCVWLQLEKEVSGKWPALLQKEKGPVVQTINPGDPDAIKNAMAKLKEQRS